MGLVQESSDQVQPTHHAQHHMWEPWLHTDSNIGFWTNSVKMFRLSSNVTACWHLKSIKHQTKYILFRNKLWRRRYITEFGFDWEHFWSPTSTQGHRMLSSSLDASQETLNSWELKGHSMSHAFEEERQAHKQTEEKARLIFHPMLQKRRDREGTLTNWRFFQI